jgi:hypothetical protein
MACCLISCIIDGRKGDTSSIECALTITSHIEFSSSEARKTFSIFPPRGWENCEKLNLMWEKL